MATDIPPVTAPFNIGCSKGLYPVQTRDGLTKADFPAAPIKLGDLAAKSVDIGLCPTVDFWGSSDSCGSMITFAFAFFDETSNVIGLSDPISLTAGPHVDAAGRFVGFTPGTLSIGSARRVAAVVLDVTAGSWQLCWRNYGIYHSC